MRIFRKSKKVKPTEIYPAPTIASGSACFDFASLYPTTMRKFKIDNKNQLRKISIKKLFDL